MGSSRTALIMDLQRFYRRIARRYQIERMILFGSQARGDAREDGDVDLIVVSPRFRRKNPIDRAYPLHLEWDLGRPVDFLCYTPDEFRDLLRRPSIVREAMREGIPVPG
jgi:predicted nucleotidyltransferase